ncbi:MAG: inositol monophosphatase family protein [Candidatus Thiodiazotropha taylori]
MNVDYVFLNSVLTSVLRDTKIGECKVVVKTDGTFVTDYDLIIERRLIAVLKKLDPKGKVISEEQHGPSEFYSDQGSIWVLDPIDGTVNIVNASGRYFTCVAHCVDGHPIFSYIYSHTENKEVFAESKFVISNLLDSPRAIVFPSLWPTHIEEQLLKSVSLEFSLIDFNYCGTAHYQELLGGHLDAIFVWGGYPWDHVPHLHLLKNKGLSIMQLDGAEFKVEINIKPGFVIYQDRVRDKICSIVSTVKNIL